MALPDASPPPCADATLLCPTRVHAGESAAAEDDEHAAKAKLAASAQTRAERALREAASSEMQSRALRGLLYQAKPYIEAHESEMLPASAVRALRVQMAALEDASRQLFTEATADAPPAPEAAAYGAEGGAQHELASASCFTFAGREGIPSGGSWGGAALARTRD